MVFSRCSRHALLALVALGVGGCSVSKLAVDRVGDALAHGPSSYATDDDPELIAAAAPFSLKLMESLLTESPNHVGLLTATAAGFTQYAYGFVQTEADKLDATDYARAQETRVRARKLYLRARDYGLRGLDVTHAGFSGALAADPEQAVRGCRKDDVGLLYWTAAAWTAAIALGKDDPSLVGDLRKPQAMMDRALELDESYGDGAIHSFMIAYSMARPDLTEPALDVAKRHYARALDLAHGSAGRSPRHVRRVRLRAARRPGLLRPGAAGGARGRPERRAGASPRKRPDAATRRVDGHAGRPLVPAAAAAR